MARQDITGGELAAEAARPGGAAERTRAAHQRAVFDSARDFAIVVTDPDGTITDWNRGAETVMGWTAAEMRGEDAERFFTPEDRAAGRVAEEMTIALRDGRAANERWHLRKDGARFFGSGEMMPLRDEGGAHLGFVKILRDRTAEHLAGKALEDAERRLSRAQEAGGVGLFTVDLASDELRPTPEFCRLYGLPVRDDYPASVLDDAIVPDDAEHALRAPGWPAAEVAYCIRRADTGAVRWISRRGEVERDDAGRPVRFAGVVRDVTAQHEASTALATSEARLGTILEAVETAFAIVEVKFDADDRPVDYRFVEANPAFESHAGVNLRGRWVTEFAPDLEKFWFETYGHVAKTGEPANFENYAEAFRRWFDVRAVRIGDPAARQIAIFFNDTTARRDAEERLRRSEKTARDNVERVQNALAAGAIIGTWLWDIAAGRFTVDEAFANAFGLDPALGREGIALARIVATVHPDDRPGFALVIKEAVRRGGRYAHQYRTRRADGTYRWLEANGHVTLGVNGTPLSFPGVLIDLEERRAVAAERDRALASLRTLTDTLEQRIAERSAELLRSEELLRQSQKMEAVGQLAGGLAHDFNNLLAGIAGSLELMNRRLKQGRLDEIDKYMTAAQGAAKRAAALTHRLLAFSRRQALDPEATDVNALVAGMRDLIQRTVGPAIAIEVVGAADLWGALVDPSQLENALLNLCINARDAMPNGGRVVIETANRRIDAPAAARQDVPEGDYLSLCVSDTGVGMAPDVLAKAFDPFFTTKQIGQGTGLGLSMIYGFAKQSGGQVRIHSAVGEGTTVCIFLPRHGGAADDGDAASAAHGPAPAPRRATVLVVDDEQVVQMLVADVLADLGTTALKASDSAAGLRVLQSDVALDLLITDVGLPGGMNGRQMADAARATRPDLKVLFITGYAENALVSSGHLDPGMSVLTKPFAMNTLTDRIRELLAPSQAAALRRP